MRSVPFLSAATPARRKASANAPPDVGSFRHGGGVRGRSSARAAAVPARPKLWPTSSSRRIVRAIRLRALSTSKTLTRTMSPAFTIERGSFTKVFAISEGLLPEDPRLNQLFRYINLEVGLVTGALLIAIGLGATVYAVGVWGQHNFGELDPAQMLRIVIPAALSLTLGFEVVLCSFFLSVLGLRRS